MARVKLDNACKHLISKGENEVFGRGRNVPMLVLDKGFECALSKYPPHKVGPAKCVARKRECFEPRTDEEEPEAAEAAPADKVPPEEPESKKPAAERPAAKKAAAKKPAAKEPPATKAAPKKAKKK